MSSAPTAFRARVAPHARRLLPPLLAAALCAGAHAADDGPADSTDTLQAVQVTAPIVKDSGTATKTDTPIVEIPQSISVVTAQQIEDRGLHGVEEAVWYLAGTQGGGYGPDPRSDWLLVRGFTPARYLDGLPLPDGGSTGITRVEPYGLEQIEVLKGPASVNYGAMPPGGMINYVSKRPTEQAFGEIELQAGSYDLRQLALDVGGPLTQDGTWLYRLTGLARNSDDVVDYVHDDRYYLAPALTWKPDDSNRLTLLGRFQKNDTVSGAGFLPAAGTLLPNPNGRISEHRFTGEPGYNDYVKTEKSLGYEYEHDFGRDLAFRQNLRYEGSDLAPNTAVGAFGLLDDQRSLLRYLYPTSNDSRMFAVDNALEWHFGDHVRHTLLGGIDYHRSRNDDASAFVLFNADGSYAVAPLDVFAPVYGSPVVTPPYSFSTRQVQKQTGAYLQDQIRVDRWVVSLGGRWDFVDTDTDDRIGGAHSSQRDHEFTGRVGVDYVFDSGFAPYIGYSESFQPTVGTDFAGRAFVPTSGRQTEAGIKYQPAGGNLLVTLAAYEITQQNTLTVDPNHTLYSVQQGETKVRGEELEGRWNIGDGLSLYGAYAHIDSEVTKTTDLASLGKQIALQPKQTASLGADYTLTAGALSGFGFGGGVRYVGAHYGDIYNEWRTPSYTLLDAAVHYEIGPWRAQVNASNLTDKRYVSVCNSAAWCYYGYPRTVSATVSYRW
ncbi:MAG TPA: TonB-dependent siderophore receptor [Dokdonella sp.]